MYMLYSNTLQYLQYVDDAQIWTPRQIWKPPTNFCIAPGGDIMLMGTKKVLHFIVSRVGYISWVPLVSPITIMDNTVPYTTECNGGC